MAKSAFVAEVDFNPFLNKMLKDFVVYQAC